MTYQTISTLMSLMTLSEEEKMSKLSKIMSDFPKIMAPIARKFQHFLHCDKSAWDRMGYTVGKVRK